MNFSTKRIFIKKGCVDDNEISYTLIQGDSWKAQYENLQELIPNVDIYVGFNTTMGVWISTIGVKKFFHENEEDAYEFCINHYHLDWGMWLEFSNKEQVFDILVNLKRWWKRFSAENSDLDDMTEFVNFCEVQNEMNVKDPCKINILIETYRSFD